VNTSTVRAVANANAGIVRAVMADDSNWDTSGSRAEALETGPAEAQQITRKPTDRRSDYARSSPPPSQECNSQSDGRPLPIRRPRASQLATRRPAANHVHLPTSVDLLGCGPQLPKNRSRSSCPPGTGST
jgi:hypothetical protein